MIQTLNGFDQTVYDSIKVSEFVEVQGEARLPQWENWSKLLTMMPAYSELGKAFGQDLLEDPKAREVFAYLSSIQKTIDTIVIVSPFGSPEFNFVAKLDRTRLSVNKDELVAEVSLLGKVTRRLSPKEKIEVVNLLPDLSKITQSLNRAQKRAQTQTQKTKAPPTSSPIDEAIEYPAIQVQPIAIYQ